jgi:hypothetical protein
MRFWAQTCAKKACPGRIAHAPLRTWYVRSGTVLVWQVSQQTEEAQRPKPITQPHNHIKLNALSGSVQNETFENKLNTFSKWVIWHIACLLQKINKTWSMLKNNQIHDGGLLRCCFQKSYFQRRRNAKTMGGDRILSAALIYIYNLYMFLFYI